MFKIEWKEGAARELTQLQHGVSSRIVKAVDSLKENPFKRDFKKLKGSPYFRLRVGDYRVIHRNIYIIQFLLLSYEERRGYWN